MSFEDDDALINNVNEEDGADDGGMYEHFRFVADKGQQLILVDKVLVSRLEH